MRSSHGEGLERDYELRSRGPATLGVEALDTFTEFDTMMQKEFHANISISACLQSVAVHPNSKQFTQPKTSRHPPPVESSYLVQMLHIAGIVQVQTAKKGLATSVYLNPSSLASK